MRNLGVAQIFFLSLFALLLGRRLLAAPLTYATVGGSSAGGQTSTDPVSSAASASFTGQNSITSTASGNAQAQMGFLHAFATATSNYEASLAGTNLIASAQARASNQGDVTFTGPNPTVTTSLNVVIDGAVSRDITPPSTGSGPQPNFSGTASVSLYVSLIGYGAGGSNELVLSSTPGTFPSSGFFTTPSAATPSVSFTSQSFTTNSFTLPTNVAIRLDLLLIAFARSSCRLTTAAPACTSTSDFSSTVHLPLNGSVFVLPDGYSAFSTDYGIVDNQFNSVPEPALMLPLGAALAVLAVARHQKQRYSPE